MPREAVIVSANLALLRQAHELVSTLPDAAFGGAEGVEKPVGPHFRHVLEHYSCFLDGLRDRRIDYDARRREEHIERDRESAAGRIRDLIDGLLALGGPGALDDEIAVRLDCGLGEEREQWSRSTVRRELHFLLSHTIHHYALIGLLLGALGIETGPDFGVAPSTLKYWNLQASCARQAG
jgi:hypothetical protein